MDAEVLDAVLTDAVLMDAEVMEKERVVERSATTPPESGGEPGTAGGHSTRHPAASRGRPRLRDDGAVAVELAFLLPVLLLLVCGIIDFGRALNAQITVSAAAREGARLAALRFPDYVVRGRVRDAAPGLPLSIDLQQSCPPIGSGFPWETPKAAVVVTYSFDFLTPVGTLAHLSGGSDSGGLLLTGKGVMRCGG